MKELRWIGIPLPKQRINSRSRWNEKEVNIIESILRTNLYVRKIKTLKAIIVKENNNTDKEKTVRQCSGSRKTYRIRKSVTTSSFVIWMSVAMRGVVEICFRR